VCSVTKWTCSIASWHVLVWKAGYISNDLGPGKVRSMLRWRISLDKISRPLAVYSSSISLPLYWPHSLNENVLTQSDMRSVRTDLPKPKASENRPALLRSS
jgi:hypothetical protein